MSRNVKELEEKIGYNFKDSHLLRHAVTHSSYVNEKHMKKADCNERLEFLGDAVLELISSEYLFFENQTMPEGELTKLRASMVCEKALAFCARDLELGSYLLLGKGEDATGGRFRESITSDALEALIGAIYLDGGFANVRTRRLSFWNTPKRTTSRTRCSLWMMATPARTMTAPAFRVCWSRSKQGV